MRSTHANILTRHSEGLNEEESSRLRHKYGPCELQIPRKGIMRLLIDEVLNPFYIFQVFSMILWFNDGYAKYAMCILFISLMGVSENLYETVTNFDKVRKMASYECPIKVKRETGMKEISSSELVPGDVVVVPEDKIMPCDLVLLSGSCIVNESMLTGESVPVIKSCMAPTRDVYDPAVPDKAKKHTLYSGTKVIQTRNVDESPVLGLVSRTGFVTTKGALIRGILYPRPIKFKFYEESYVFVAAMALVAVLGFCATIPLLIKHNASALILIGKSLDLITVTVPPALPATMSAGVAFAVSRLKKSQIYCISP